MDTKLPTEQSHVDVPRGKLVCNSTALCESGNAQSSRCGLSAWLKRSLCRMFAAGSARPDKEGGKPAQALQQKGSLIQAEERATGVLLLSPTHGCPSQGLVLGSRAAGETSLF